MVSLKLSSTVGLIDGGAFSSFQGQKVDKRFLFLCLSPPGDRWCDALGFVPAGSVSSSSPLQIFRDATRL